MSDLGDVLTRIRNRAIAAGLITESDEQILNELRPERQVSDLAIIIKAKDAEISRLKEELKEAREIVSATADYLSDEWFPHISKKGNSRSRIKERARAFLDRGE